MATLFNPSGMLCLGCADMFDDSFPRCGRCPVHPIIHAYCLDCSLAHIHCSACPDHPELELDEELLRKLLDEMLIQNEQLQTVKSKLMQLSLREVERKRKAKKVNSFFSFEMDEDVRASSKRCVSALQNPQPIPPPPPPPCYHREKYGPVTRRLCLRCGFYTDKTHTRRKDQEKCIYLCFQCDKECKDSFALPTDASIPIICDGCKYLRMWRDVENCASCNRNLCAICIK